MATFDSASLFKKRPVKDVLGKDVFRKAALLYHCDLESDFENFSEEDVEEVRKRCYRRPEGNYRLRIGDRIKILRDHIGVENLVDAIEEFQIETEFTDIIRQIVTQESIDYNAMTNAGLYYAGKLVALFPNRLDEERISELYQRRQLLVPFRRLTRNFAGRREELQEVSDYVDWLPKSTLTKQVFSHIRNLINWNDKPPLLLKGIGGIGKSTIVAKFILEQNSERNGRQLPFVYIDFDLPGFSIREPMTILLEAIRQIAAQFPRQKENLSRIRMHVENMIFKDDEPQKVLTKMEALRATSRGVVFDSIHSLIDNYGGELADLGRRTPILVVFDSFEEMQYRATSTEMYSFFSFIREISERLPRVRPIFAGRAEVSERLSDVKFRTLEVTDFDAESANALLEKWGVDDSHMRDFIFETFGGNPLMLRLATDLAHKDEFDLNNPEDILEKKWEYLVGRIKEHINDEDVKKLAVPGMLVRYVNAEIIQKVLARPVGLGDIDSTRANQLFEELRKEVALITKVVDSEEFMFRQDLRMTCESMIFEKYPKNCRDIRNAALEYYSNYESIDNTTQRAIHAAEYHFHLFKSGEIPEGLSIEEYDSFRKYLEPAIIELPQEAQLFLSSLVGQNVANETINQASDEEWERYYSTMIRQALHGELQQLKDLRNDIEVRSNRGEAFPMFMVEEALLYQRLGEIGKSRKALDLSIFEPSKNLFKTSFSKVNRIQLNLRMTLTWAESFEYQERYTEGLDVLKNQFLVYKTLTGLPKLKYYMMLYRMLCRIEAGEDDEQLKNSALDHLLAEHRRLQSGDAFQEEDVKVSFLVEHLNPENIAIKPHKLHNDEYRRLRSELRNLETLDRYCFSKYGLFLKDISYAGEFGILLRDVIWAGELLGEPVPVP